MHQRVSKCQSSIFNQVKDFSLHCVVCGNVLFSRTKREVVKRKRLIEDDFDVPSRLAYHSNSQAQGV
jgi:hypothetical protein